MKRECEQTACWERAGDGRTRSAQRRARWITRAREMIMQRSAPRERTLAGAERAERRLGAEVVLPGADHETKLRVNVRPLRLLCRGLSHCEELNVEGRECCDGVDERREKGSGGGRGGCERPMAVGAECQALSTHNFYE